MAVIADRKNAVCMEDFVPTEFRDFDDVQTAIPALAKDPRRLSLIREAIQTIPTQHDLIRADAREISLPEETATIDSVNVARCSPISRATYLPKTLAGPIGDNCARKATTP